MSATPSSETAAPAKPKKGKKSLTILLTIIVIGGGVAAFEIISHRGLQSTDNAQLESEIVPVPTRVGGIVVEVRVADNQRVKKGDVLALIDDTAAKARFAQAEAAVKAAEAKAATAEVDARVANTNAAGNFDVASASRISAASEVTAARTQLAEASAAVKAAEAAASQARVDRDRDAQLHSEGVVSEATLQTSKTRAQVAGSNLEAAKAHLASQRAVVEKLQSRIGEANARVEQTKDLGTFDAQAKARAAASQADVAVAKAARDVAALDVEYATIRAPQDGVLSKKSVAVGQMLAPGQAVGLLVTDEFWVTANFKETQLQEMREGQVVKIEIDAFPDAAIAGELDSLAGATGARFSLLPPDNASGNYTKVVQRVPARVRLTKVPEGVALRPGLSVSVTVNTRAGSWTPRAATSVTAHVE